MPAAASGPGKCAVITVSCQGIDGACHYGRGLHGEQPQIWFADVGRIHFLPAVFPIMSMTWVDQAESAETGYSSTSPEVFLM